MRDTAGAPQPPTNPPTGHQMSQQAWPKMTKSFGTHITEKPPRHLVCLFFCSCMGSDGPKRPIFGQKCQFRSKFGLSARNVSLPFCSFRPDTAHFQHVRCNCLKTTIGLFARVRFLSDMGSGWVAAAGLLWPGGPSLVMQLLFQACRRQPSTCYIATQLHTLCNPPGCGKHCPCVL